MEKRDFNSALCMKIMESFNESINDIMRGLSKLEKNYQQDEFLDLNAREEILDAGYVLETAIYRAISYQMDTKSVMQPELQKLNSAVNQLAMKTNHEFLKTFNLKVVGLTSLFIVYSI